VTDDADAGLTRHELTTGRAMAKVAGDQTVAPWRVLGWKRLKHPRTAMTRPLIVHPTDLLSTSERAFHHALKIALARRSRLALVHAHAVGHAGASLDAFPGVRDTLAEWGVLPRGAPPEAVGQQLGLLVSKVEVAAKEPRSGLERMFGDEGLDLVVVGTRALDGLDHLLQGSFSEGLARRLRAAALFVPAGCDGFVDAASGGIKLRNVLVPVAARPSCAAALKAARRLIEDLGADAAITLLHVGGRNSMPSHELGHGPAPAEIVRSGGVVETIATVADEISADLIVMATAGHKGLLDALRGDTTEGVLRRTRRPVLATPAV